MAPKAQPVLPEKVLDDLPDHQLLTHLCSGLQHALAPGPGPGPAGSTGEYTPRQAGLALWPLGGFQLPSKRWGVSQDNLLELRTMPYITNPFHKQGHSRAQAAPDLPEAVVGSATRRVHSFVTAVRSLGRRRKAAAERCTTSSGGRWPQAAADVPGNDPSADSALREPRVLGLPEMPAHGGPDPEGPRPGGSPAH